MSAKILCRLMAVLLVAALIPAACAAPAKGERAEGKPEARITVIRFENIPAVSFVDTLRQLGRNPHVAEMIEQMPIAVNEPANAIVIIAPAEAAERLVAMAKDLDKPPLFHEKMRQQRIQEMEMRAKLGAPIGPPMGAPVGRPGGPMQPGPGGPMMGPGGPMMRQGPGGPPMMQPGQPGGAPMMKPGTPMMPGKPGGPMMQQGPGPMAPQMPGMRPGFGGPGMDGKGRPPMKMERSGKGRHHGEEDEEDDDDDAVSSPAERPPVVPAVEERSAKFFLVAETVGAAVAEPVQVQPAPAAPAPAANPRTAVRQFGMGMEAMRSQQIVRLLEDAAIREQLALTPEQDTHLKAVLEKMKAMRDSVQEKLKAAQPVPDPDQPLTADQQAERARQTREAMQALQTDLAPAIKEAMDILTAAQKAKLEDLMQKQMRARAAGAIGQLLSGKIKEDLKLTDDQVETIQKIAGEAIDKAQAMMREKMEALKDLPEEERGPAMQKAWQEMRDQREAFMKETREKVMATLDPEQREKAEKLMAERGPNRPRNAQPGTETPAPAPAPAPGQ